MKKSLALIFWFSSMAVNAYAEEFSLERVTAQDLATYSAQKTQPPAARPADSLQDILPPGLPGTETFKRLQNLFNGGAPATRMDLTGVYSGRYVSPMGSVDGIMLMGWISPATPYGILPTDKEKNFHVLYRIAVTMPTLYDNYSGGIDAPSGYAVHFPQAQASWGTSEYKNLLEFRKAAGGIVMHITTTQPATGMTSGCYAFFFKKLK